VVNENKPEERVRQQVLRELRQMGWPEDRLRWRPEWPVPKTPHDLTKRERGQRCTHITGGSQPGRWTTAYISCTPPRWLSWSGGPK
jgi:hypothetical protein